MVFDDKFVNTFTLLNGFYKIVAGELKSQCSTVQNQPSIKVYMP